MTDERKWRAVLRHDGRYDGLFFFGVKSTKIFCRPSCKSKRPLRKNILFFENSKQAEQAGYRPCKRCRPDLLEYRPVGEIAEKAKLLIDNCFARQKKLPEEMGRIGVTYHRMARIFKEYYGLTPKKYYDNLRIEDARKKLARTEDAIIDVAYSAGFQSLSAFYSAFQKSVKLSPSKYRKEGKCGIRS
ncbi:MAG: helix-turn-helix domain-containing protein [Treponema sp.]|jgi:AraC family transcriptional regulator of adaptative response / methylphosphotriester-DNA alkyltransferase methyltransferase|nr:helix-turn-helix domain-containing protein [Treponema sp.]